MTNESSWKSVLINSALSALAYFLLSLMTVRIGADLDVYLRATHTVILGANPYSLQTVNELTSGPPIIDGMPYLYSPASFIFFLPFDSLEKKQAVFLFHSLMAVCFGFSVFTLCKFICFKNKLDYLVYFALSLTGMGFPIFFTILFQNSAPIEWLSIIAGTYFLIKRKMLLGTLFFLPSIIIKLQPLLLLVMLVWALERSVYKTTFVALLSVATGFAVPAILRPDLMLHWFFALKNGPWMSDPGDLSILRLIYSVGVEDSKLLLSFQILLQGFVLLFTYVGIRNLSYSSSTDRLKICLFIILAYMIAMPRLKPYVMILSVPALLPLLSKKKFIVLTALTTALMVIGGPTSSVATQLAILFTLVLMWLSYFCEFNKAHLN